MAEGDHEPVGLLRGLQLLLEPAVLRVVEVAGRAAALGDGVERDELDALARAERVVGRGAVGRAVLRGVDVAVAVARPPTALVLGRGEDAAVRVRRDFGRRPAAGDERRVADRRKTSLSSAPANARRVERRRREDLQAAGGDRAEEVVAGGRVALDEAVVVAAGDVPRHLQALGLERVLRALEQARVARERGVRAPAAPSSGSQKPP